MNKGTLIAIGCVVVIIVLFVLLLLVGIGAAMWLGFKQKPVLTPGESSSDGPISVVLPEEMKRRGSYVFTRRNEIYFVQSEGAEPRRITHGTFPSLSPDGTRIAYCKLKDDGDNFGSTSIVSFNVVDVATGADRELIPTEGAMSPPAWSPDGTRIALLLFTGLNARVIIADADGGTPFEAWANQENGGMLFNVSWAADGASVYCHDMRELITVAASGEVSNRRSLADFVGDINMVTSSDRFLQSPTDPNVWVVTFSADGSRRFQEVLNGDMIQSVFVVDLSNGNRRKITVPNMQASDISISRDGKSVLFCGYKDAEAMQEFPFGIWKIGIDGAGLTRLGGGDSPSY